MYFLSDIILHIYVFCSQSFTDVHVIVVQFCDGDIDVL